MRADKTTVNNAALYVSTAQQTNHALLASEINLYQKSAFSQIAYVRLDFMIIIQIKKIAKVNILKKLC